MASISCFAIWIVILVFFSSMVQFVIIPKIYLQNSLLDPVEVELRSSFSADISSYGGKSKVDFESNVFPFVEEQATSNSSYSSGREVTFTQRFIEFHPTVRGILLHLLCFLVVVCFIVSLLDHATKIRDLKKQYLSVVIVFLPSVYAILSLVGYHLVGSWLIFVEGICEIYSALVVLALLILVLLSLDVEYAGSVKRSNLLKVLVIQSVVVRAVGTILEMILVDVGWEVEGVLEWLLCGIYFISAFIAGYVTKKLYHATSRHSSFVNAGRKLSFTIYVLDLMSLQDTVFRLAGVHIIVRSCLVVPQMLWIGFNMIYLYPASEYVAVPCLGPGDNPNGDDPNGAVGDGLEMPPRPPPQDFRPPPQEFRPPTDILGPTSLRPLSPLPPTPPPPLGHTSLRPPSPLPPTPPPPLGPLSLRSPRPPLGPPPFGPSPLCHPCFPPGPPPFIPLPPLLGTEPFWPPFAPTEPPPFCPPPIPTAVHLFRPPPARLAPVLFQPHPGPPLLIFGPSGPPPACPRPPVTIPGPPAAPPRPPEAPS